jgi:D-serine deaminase-like pyridoxal phosphate-dependent protein
MTIVRSDLIGLPKDTLDTPALMVDLDVMEANIAEIARVCRESGVSWRPHIKGQKTPEIVAKEMAAGAIGVTCAKLGEAEVMAAAGIRDILVANQIVGPAKMARLRALLESADPVVAIDSQAHVAALAEAMAGVPRPLRVVIEVNIGMNRAGVEPGAPVVSLANAIAGHDCLRFSGLMGWEGQTVAAADLAEKEQSVARAVGPLTASAEACRQAGFRVDIVSCGGTGTFPYCARQPGVTEVQVGGGIFSDEHYRSHFHVEFPCALTLLATVISRPTSERIVLDAGKKSMSGDAAMPRPLALPGIRTMRLSAEHFTIELEAPSHSPEVGEHVELVVGYSDTTVHLHDWIVAVRRGRVEAIWEVAARGKSQ